MAANPPVRWLILLYQFPRGPGARRVKVWRRLQNIGAIAVRNSAWVLPDGDTTREDLEWLLSELRAQGGDGLILRSQVVDGMTDAELRAQFDAARTADYLQLRDDIRAAAGALARPGKRATDDARIPARQALARAQKRLTEIEAIDFFAAPGRDEALSVLGRLTLRASPGTHPDSGKEASAMPASMSRDLKHRVWVTRRGVRVDRIASAWLIRRWIDPAARFKFVADAHYRPGSRELRFDMFEAEFTHEGDRCTFEVLAGRARPGDAALRRVGEVVHDIDLKDGKYGRPETEGVSTLLNGIVSTTADDAERIARGSALFEDLYRGFAGRRG